jgi:hypothetical protein
MAAEAVSQVEEEEVVGMESKNGRSEEILMLRECLDCASLSQTIASKQISTSHFSSQCGIFVFVMHQ